MKYLLFMILTLSTFAFTKHGYISLDIVKDTNGSYTYSIPNVHAEEVNGYFIHVTDLKLNFTAPRGDYSSLNHYNFEFNNAYGITTKDWFATISLDVKYYFEDNVDKIDEGAQFGNTLRFGVNF